MGAQTGTHTPINLLPPTLRCPLGPDLGSPNTTAVLLRLKNTREEAFITLFLG